MRSAPELRLGLLFFILFAPITLAAGHGLTFEPNVGQTGPDIQYIARASSGVIFIIDRGIILSGTDTLFRPSNWRAAICNPNGKRKPRAVKQ